MLMNMFALYFFGRHTLQLVGPRRFLGLYFAGSLLASAAQVAYQMYLLDPADRRKEYRTYHFHFRISFPSSGLFFTHMHAHLACSLGASGGVNSLVTLSCLRYASFNSQSVKTALFFLLLSAPLSMVHLYGVLPVPAALFGTLFVFQDVLYMWLGDENTGKEIEVFLNLPVCRHYLSTLAACAAHLGGAVVGALFFAVVRRRLPVLPKSR
jgi:membrane associated rhomboid family serine protease